MSEITFEIFDTSIGQVAIPKSTRPKFQCLGHQLNGARCHAEDGLWGPVDEMDLVVYFNEAFLFWSMGCRLVISPTLGGYAKEIHSPPTSLCWRQDHITYLSWILVWFEAASGLRINLAKSEVIPVGEVEDIEMLAVELGCKVGTLPSVYLGLPLGAKHKAMAMWDGVEARMRRRLALWKRQYLSKGGRITLIKSTLASMPIYQLSLFRMPKLVVKRLEKLQRDFLWGGGSMERKIHLINWAVVCTQKESGGLGGWGEVWRLGFGWRTKEARGTFGVGVWRDILKESSWCWDNIEFKVGKGTKVNFWTDHWCGNEVLAQTFPQLFELAVQRNASVNEMWDSSLGQGGWNIRLSRNFNDWELDALGELLHLLRDLRTSLEEDAVIWKGESHGLFRIRDAYKLLSGV
ncbi:putative ribonuclease H protein [Vitis vinifera]|uniref:Putative ribonuclease H protein n=1 Tax=Vitis vinifera TaxID=29760 RepID=A0A438DGH0_VITVI|nr:putative ribonuclease H protein [Vitis vinifera]